MRNVYIVEYRDFFKIAIAKILDFLRRLKTRFKALTRYKLWLRKSKQLLDAIFRYPNLNLMDSLVRKV